jgi:hypothetical protein
MFIIRIQEFLKPRKLVNSSPGVQAVILNISKECQTLNLLVTSNWQPKKMSALD